MIGRRPEILLDFAPPSRHTSFGWLLALVGACGCAVMLPAWWEARAALLAQPAPAVQRNLSRPIARPSDDPVAARRDQSVRAELARPWDRLLAALEGATDPRVRWLAIEPNAATGQAVLVGQTLELTAAIDMARALDRAGLAEVGLLSHEKQADAPEFPIRFDLSVRWAAPAGVR